jgi:hypothetical protein
MLNFKKCNNTARSKNIFAFVNKILSFYTYSIYKPLKITKQ